MSGITSGSDVSDSIKAVHDGVEGVDWTLIGYQDKGALSVISSGAGALEELSGSLPGDAPAFGLIRYPLVIDRSKMVRFAFIDWTPVGVHPLTKSLVSTQKGAIKKLFDPIHVDLTCADSSDLDESWIKKKIGLASGTADNVVESKHDPKQNAPRSGHVAAGAAKSPPNAKKIGTGITLKYANEDEFKAAMKEVHSIEGANNWVLATLKGEELAILNCGNGETEDMLASIVADAPSYGLMRVVDMIDKKPTVKFAFFVVMPDSVPPLRKAKLSLMTGAIQEQFRPYHVDFLVENPSEVSHKDVTDKIGAASGSKSYVK